ncbi:TolC family protein [Pseudomonas nitroreducens]|uniref:TolC family protein n=1 Tax=Pseudomonas nitroreducens TaxID=46680 RepID=UPI00382FC556
MKPYKPSKSDRKRSWLSGSALAVALASLSAVAAPVALAADDDSELLSFQSKPAATASSNATSTVSPANPAAAVKPMGSGAKAPAPVDRKTFAASTLDLSLPASLASNPRQATGLAGTSAVGADLQLSTLEYIRNMVGTALSISPEMKQASASLGAAQSDVDQAKGARWPQVQLGLNSPTYRTKKEDGDGDGSGSSVQVVTPVYDFGAIRNTIDSRNKTANAQEQAMEQARVTVAYNTVASLLELSHQQEALSVTDQYVARMRELVDMLSQISQVDPGRRSEVVQARSRLLQAETARANVQAKLQQVKTSLAKLVSEDVEVPASVKWEWTPMNLDKALKDMQESPAIQQARWEMDAARANAESVKSSQLPALNWVVGRNTGNDVFSNNEPWSTGLAVQWNAFQGGAGRAAQRAAYQRADAAEQRMETARREAEYQIRNLAEQRDLAVTRISEFDSLLKESDGVRKMFYDQWYHLGKRTLLDVLIAENDYYSGQVQAIDNFYASKSADLQIRSEASGLLAWLAVDGERPATQR